MGNPTIRSIVLIVLVLVISVFGASCGDEADMPEGFISGKDAYLTALGEALQYAERHPLYRSKPLLTTRENLHPGSTSALDKMPIWIVAFEFGQPVALALPSHRCPPGVDPCPPRFNARVVGVNARDGDSIGGSSLYPTSPRRFMADIPVTAEDIRAASKAR